MHVFRLFSSEDTCLAAYDLIIIIMIIYSWIDIFIYYNIILAIVLT